MTTRRPALPLVAIVALFALMVTGCAPIRNATPTPELSDVMSAQATEIYSGASSQVAIAQATYVAKQAEIRATSEYQATDIAVNATINAHDIGYIPTRVAIQSTIDAARAGEAKANYDIARLNVALAVTQQAQSVKLQSMDIVSKSNAIAAQAIALEATATATAKQIENSKTLGDGYGIISLIATVLVEIGLPLIALIGALIGLRKWQQKDIVQQPHPDGPAFEIRHSLLKAPEPFIIWNPFEERRKYLSLPSPQEPGLELNHTPIYKGEHLVSVVDTESARELSEAELMRKRVLNFLRLVIEYYADDPDCVVVPHWESLKALAEERGMDTSAGSNEWVAVTDSLEGAGCISKSQGKKTLLIGKYMTFSDLYGAIGQKRIPLPVVIRQKGAKQSKNSTVQYSQNSLQQSQTVTDPILTMPGVTRS